MHAAIAALLLTGWPAIPAPEAIAGPPREGAAAVAPVAPGRTTGGGRARLTKHAADSVADAIGRLTAGPPAAPRITAMQWQRARGLYALRANRPAWVTARGLDPRAVALIVAVSGAGMHGLRPADYPLGATHAALAALVAGQESGGAAGPTADQWARADVLLMTLFAAYGADMLGGRVDARAVEPRWHVTRGAADVDSVLARTVADAAFGDALARLAPHEEGYDVLLRELRRYRKIAGRAGWPQVPEGPPLVPGDSSDRVPVLRARLAAEELLGAPAGDSTAWGYDSAAAAAVARFQERHGLAADRVVGPQTLRALNVPADRRALQIAANLERYRWLPRDLGERYVVVNIPAFRLAAYDGGERVLTMRVVVGSELDARATPVFSDSMSYVQFGPYWNVPPRIARREILPEARRDRGYLARNGYEIVRGWAPNAPVVDPWSLSDAALFSPRYRVRQRPGPQNALGGVKFMFPNDFHVYLHDTPARELFDERVRAASHGCVRVERPAELARFVLADRTDWSEPRVRETLATGRSVRVVLPRKLPVYLLYLTAFEYGGVVAFRDDLYGMDDRLMRALEAPPADAGAPVATR